MIVKFRKWLKWEPFGLVDLLKSANIIISVPFSNNHIIIVLLILLI